MLTILKQLILVILIGLFTPKLLASQYLEFGLKSGVVVYDGDLNTSIITTNITNGRWSNAIFLKYNFKKHFAIQLNYLRGNLYGDDAKSLIGWQTTRNLSFQSNISEYSFLIDLHLAKGKKTFQKLNPYLFFGIGYFQFDPYTQYLNDKIYLKDLGTEGQGIAGYDDLYSLKAYSFPLGIGIKKEISKHIYLGIELSTRWTSTDYIDDIHGDYIPDHILRSGNGDLSADLANRSGEVLDNGRKDLTGINRGDPSNDSFYTGLVTLSISFPKFNVLKWLNRKRVICP